MNNFFNFFIGTDFPITFILLIIGVFFSFVLLIIYIPIIINIFFPKFGYKKYSYYLPFKSIGKNNYIVLSDGSICKGYKIEGLQINSINEQNNIDFLNIKAEIFNKINDNDVILRFFSIRDFIKEDLNYEFDQIILQKLFNKWNSQGLKIFKNSYYLIISVNGNNSLEKLEKYSNYIESILSSYKIKLLEHNKSENLAKLFARILSPISKPNIKECNSNINNLVTVDNVEFLKNGYVYYNGAGKESFSALISFQVSPDFLDDNFFNSILTIQTEMIIMNAFKIINNKDIEKIIRQKRSVINKNEDLIEEQISEAELMIDENISETQTFVDYYPLFVLFSDNIDDLKLKIDEFRTICANFGISPVVENFASKVSWFSQIPSFDVFPRSFKMLSKSAAVSIPLLTTSEGILNSDWGNGPLLIFPTAQGTVYKFQFHVSDAPFAVGHTLVIGPTGGGKTTLFSFLISQSLRHKKLKSFFFDRNKGAEIFTLSVGGKYVVTQNKEKIKNDFLTHLNPLKMEDSINNRAFLRRWFSLITGKFDSKSTEEIARAVSINFDYLSDKDRMLKNLWESCFSYEGEMREALKQWIDELQYGYLFNEEIDTLDLESRLTTFDFTHILQDNILAPAVISYILHRININTILGGNPSLIMIDETAPMLENKMFRDNFIAGLKEGRKNRQAYMTAFQSASFLDNIGIGDVVRGQAQTVLFFRNQGANINDYSNWNLNPLEMDFIKGKAYPNLKRAVLLLRPVNRESVILNTELGGLGSYLKLFESGRSNVLLAEELYKNYGSNFVQEYLKKQGNF